MEKQNSETTTPKINFDPMAFQRIVERIDSKLDQYKLSTSVLFDRQRTAERTITEQQQMVNSLETEVTILQKKNLDLASMITRLVANYTDDEL
jgi:anion-transporting  ArsA/GET3 family ATPase